MMNTRKANSLATSYRLNIDPRRVPAKTVERTKKASSDTSSDRGTSECSSLDNDFDDSFMNNNLYLSDYDSDFEPECEDDEPVPLAISLKVYLRYCEKHGRIPYSCIQKGLDKGMIRCKYQHLHPSDVRAICCALSQSWMVDSIDFEHNEIGPEGAILFSSVLTSIPYLTQVRLASNKIGPQGTRDICEAVQSSSTITVLDLSGNGLDEGNGVHIQKLIEESDMLQELYLSENELMQKGVEAIATGLTYTSSLKILDLKWNHIRLKGASAIGRAIRNNSSLEKIDVSWNGLYIDGAVAIAVGLPKNDTLIELDISRNRLDEKCFVSVLSGLRDNSTLKRLRAAGNHITSKGAKTIVTELKKYQKSGLELIDLGTLDVSDSFVKEYNELRQTRDIEILHGAVLDRKPMAPVDDNDESVISALLRCDPLVVILESIRLLDLRLVDFFMSLDKDRNNMLSLEELCDGLLQIKLPIPKNALRVLIKQLDVDGNGHIDYLELLKANKLHKAMIRELMHQHMDIEATEIGRVIFLLTKVLRKKPRSAETSIRSEHNSKVGISNIKDSV